MRALAFAADAADAVPPRGASSSTAIFTVFLIGGGYEQEHGSFGTKRPWDLFKLTDALVERSPGICAPGTTLTVIHDVATDVRVRRGVRYIRVPRLPRSEQVPPDNRRWMLIEEALRALRAGAPRAAASGAPRAIGSRAELRAEVLAEAAECAYAIDITDVSVVRVPPCAALAEYLPDRVLISTDGQNHGIRNWLHKAARRTWLLNSSSAMYHLLLDGATNDVIFNCGIVGGRIDVFGRWVRAVADRLREHWATVPRPPMIAGGDMVVWNALLDDERRVHTGYPFGAVSLPMWGGLLPAHKDVTGRRFCEGACRHAWLNATRGLYWFAHKTPMSWPPLAAPRRRRCYAPGDAPITKAERAEIVAAEARANKTKILRAARMAAREAEAAQADWEAAEAEVQAEAAAVAAIARSRRGTSTLRPRAGRRE